MVIDVEVSGIVVVVVVSGIVVDNVFIPETREAIKAGSDFVTFDEPAYTTIPDDREIYTEAYDRLFKIVGRYAKQHKNRIGFHTCFSNRYDILYEDLPKIPWDYGSLECANRDAKTPGTSHSDRPSYREGVENVVYTLYPDFTWEKTEIAPILREEAGL